MRTISAWAVAVTLVSLSPFGRADEPAKKAAPKKDDPFAAGAVWQGRLIAGVPAGHKGRKFVLSVDERKGAAVKGEVAVYGAGGENKMATLPFTGDVTADGAGIKFKTGTVGFQHLKGTAKVVGGAVAGRVEGKLGSQGEIVVDHKVSLGMRE